MSTEQLPEIMKNRADIEVPQSITEVTKALQNKDFESLAPVIMRESDSLHSICHQTGLSYMNDCTKEIIKMVNEINKEAGHYILAYTVDAGANVFLICEMEKMESLFGCL
jgi:diphosphomevalonate decarboxylase